MQNLINIDMAQLDRNIAVMEAELAEVQREVDECYQSVLQLNAKWKGQASDVFKEAYTNDHNDMLTICNNLRTLINTIKQASEKYKLCERETKEIVDSIDV